MTTIQPVTHRSFSQIKSYLTCAKQYQLQRLVRVPEVPAWYLCGGSAVHAVAEAITITPSLDTDAITDLWIKAWEKEVTDLAERSGVPTDQWRAAGRATKDKPNKEDGEWWIQEGHQMCLRYSGWLSSILEQGWQVFDDGRGPWVERGVNVTVGGAHTKMFLDALFVMPGGELIVVDHKTGSRAPDAQQLRLYALGLDRAGQPRPSLGAYWMARTGELTAPTVLDDSMDVVLDDTFANVDEGIKAGRFPAHVSSMCSGCGVNRYCAAFGGADAKDFDPIYSTDRKA